MTADCRCAALKCKKFIITLVYVACDVNGCPITGSSPNVEIEIAVHGGTFFYYTAHGHPPLKMIPPYQFGDYEQLHGQSVTFGLCNMEPGKHYVAIK